MVCTQFEIRVHEDRPRDGAHHRESFPARITIRSWSTHQDAGAVYAV